MRESFWQDLGDRVVDYIAFSRKGEIISGRPLQHGHMLSPTLHERGHQRHSGGATADNHNLFPLVCDVVRPLLRVYNLTLELLDAVPLGRVALVIPVVARCHVQPPTHVLHAVPGCQGPFVGGRVEGSGRHMLAHVNVLVQLVLHDSLLQVGHDVSAGADDRGLVPRFPPEPKCVHIGVGSNAGVLKERPRAADLAATLKHSECLIRAFRLEVVRHAHAADAAAKHDNIHL
mmetsp:Transcript_9884/g.23282  ORF Transcript_9884/g.23282 Transcript_9884/m.23282 type:complete len:231 (-) Transcript_9884:203-895(-)